MEWYNRTDTEKNNALPWRSNKGRPLINGRHHLLLEWKDNKIQVVELLKLARDKWYNNKIRKNSLLNTKKSLKIFADGD